MKNIKKIILLAFFLVVGLPVLFAWGAWGHQHINRAAVLALPPEIGQFFYNHIDFVTEESVVPDLRKYTINDKAEFPRHYINPESFGNLPLNAFPKTMQEAKAMFPDSVLQKNGILPWYIIDMTNKLTQAFKNKRKTEILFLAADLGHYIGDAYMPLHTSVNHDGQLTNQKGIHAFFESQLPEMFGDTYNLHTGQAAYITDITAETWRIVEHSHQLADSVLDIEKRLKENFPADQIFEKDSTGAVLKNKFNQPVHTAAYTRRYHDMLHGMVENQLRDAVASTASFWYTAWVNAGKPDCSDLDPPALTKRNRKNYQADEKLWKKSGKVFGVMAEKEF